MNIRQKPFGTLPGGGQAVLYTLENDTGAKAVLTNYGGAVVELWMPDRAGRFADVACGYDTLEGYLGAGGFQGAIIGRFANRIAGGAFSLSGKTYQLNKNEGGITHLHGGPMGFDRQLWEGEALQTPQGPCLRLKRISPDGEEGYPGNLQVEVQYLLTQDNALSISYHAVADRDTVVSLTNHTYFNLAGYHGGDVLGHTLCIHANAITEIDEWCVPTGTLLPVAGTPFDFTLPKLIGRDIGAKNEQLRLGGGYDHNFVLSPAQGVREASWLWHEPSGRVLTVLTDRPGLQLYTGNNMNDPHPFKGGVKQTPRHALCLETQAFPDSPNHQNFPSALLKAGESYQSTTLYRFGVK